MLSQQDYWQVQDPKKPLYDDILWSRPENKLHAGKILIVGGNAFSFSDVANSFNLADKAGAGSIRVVMPDTLKKSVGKAIDNAFFCPSTPSGSFARRGLAELLDHASWANIVLLAGDFGRNSETAILLESFIKEYKGSLCLTKDALAYFISSPISLLARPQTVVVATMAELQKMSIKVSPSNVIKFNMSLVQLTESLHNITLEIPAIIITKHLDEIVIGANGKISSTKIPTKFDPWRSEVTAFASVYLMQNMDQPYEAITSSVIALSGGQGGS